MVERSATRAVAAGRQQQRVTSIVHRLLGWLRRLQRRRQLRRQLMLLLTRVLLLLLLHLLLLLLLQLYRSWDFNSISSRNGTLALTMFAALPCRVL